MLQLNAGLSKRFYLKEATVEDAHLYLRCHLLLLVSQFHAGALPGGEVLGGGNHLPVFKLQVLHQQLPNEHTGVVL